MTALVVVGIFALLAVLAFATWVAYVKALGAKALRNIIGVQSTLIMDIEEKAMQYGYADPLAYDIVQTIRETRKSLHKKENL